MAANINREVSTMIAAASAFPLLLIAQLAHIHFQWDVVVGGGIVFVDRAVYVASLGLYALWLGHGDKVATGMTRTLAVLAGVGIFAIFLPRMYAIPIVWVLQLGILAALALWAHSERRDGWRCGFIGAALVAQAIGALTIMPLCQLGASPEWLALPQARYVCNTVIGPALAAMLPAGLGSVAWVVLAIGALATKRV